MPDKTGNIDILRSQSESRTFSVLIIPESRPHPWRRLYRRVVSRPAQDRPEPAQTVPQQRGGRDRFRVTEAVVARSNNSLMRIRKHCGIGGPVFKRTWILVNNTFRFWCGAGVSGFQGSQLQWLYCAHAFFFWHPVARRSGHMEGTHKSSS